MLQARIEAHPPVPVSPHLHAAPRLSIVALPCRPVSRFRSEGHPRPSTARVPVDSPSPECTLRYSTAASAASTSGAARAFNRFAFNVASDSFAINPTPFRQIHAPVHRHRPPSPSGFRFRFGSRFGGSAHPCAGRSLERDDRAPVRIVSPPYRHGFQRQNHPRRPVVPTSLRAAPAASVLRSSRESEPTARHQSMRRCLPLAQDRTSQSPVSFNPTCRLRGDVARPSNTAQSCLPASTANADRNSRTCAASFEFPTNAASTGSTTTSRGLMVSTAAP